MQEGDPRKNKVVVYPDAFHRPQPITSKDRTAAQHHEGGLFTNPAMDLPPLVEDLSISNLPEKVKGQIVTVFTNVVEAIARIRPETDKKELLAVRDTQPKSLALSMQLKVLRELGTMCLGKDHQNIGELSIPDSLVGNSDSFPELAKVLAFTENIELEAPSPLPERLRILLENLTVLKTKYEVANQPNLVEQIDLVINALSGFREADKEFFIEIFSEPKNTFLSDVQKKIFLDLNTQKERLHVSNPKDSSVAPTIIELEDILERLEFFILGLYFKLMKEKTELAAVKTEIDKLMKLFLTLYKQSFIEVGGFYEALDVSRKNKSIKPFFSTLKK